MSTLMLVDELSLGLMPNVVDECYNALEKLVKGIAVILVDQNSVQQLISAPPH